MYSRRFKYLVIRAAFLVSRLFVGNGLLMYSRTATSYKMYPHPIGFKVDFQPKVINAQYIVNFFAKPATGLALIRFYYLLWSELLQPYQSPKPVRLL